MRVFLIKIRIFAVALVPLFFLILSFVSVADSAKARVIDKHGRQIPNLFYGTAPDSRVALEYFRNARASGENGRSCSVRKAIYRESDGLGRLVKVVAMCLAHYQVDEFRNCESYCGGGQEQWTYSDALIATYCDGYTWDYTACGSGQCYEEFTCFSCL